MKILVDKTIYMNGELKGRQKHRRRLGSVIKSKQMLDNGLTSGFDTSEFASPDRIMDLSTSLLRLATYRYYEITCPKNGRQAHCNMTLSTGVGEVAVIQSD